MPDQMTLQEKQMQMAEELLFSGKKLPSFAKTLFFGLFDATRAFPFPYPDANERIRTETFCKELNAWANEHLDPVAIDREENIPDSVIAGLGKLGVLGCTIPEQYEGLGFTQYAYCRMNEEIARRCGSTSLFVNAHQSIGMKALLLYGTNDQKDRWLPPLGRGEILAAFALTEPNAGSDAAAVETRAVYDPVEKVYRLTGRKQWITNGGIADILTVMAQCEVDTPRGKEDKITAFLVTPDLPGFHVDDVALEKVGMRGTKTARLHFDNMPVPEANILGPFGEGLKVALTVLNYGRTTFGAGCTGNCKEMVRLATEHSMKRVQFGRPIAGFGLVKEKIAKMSALVYAMDATTYMTAGLLDRGEEDYMLETAILKVFASDCQWKICYDAMQILGGKSFFTDQPFERMMRDARLNTIGEGSNEVMRAFIGAVGIRDVGMQLKDIADSFKTPLSGIGKALGFGRDNLSKLLKSQVVPVKSTELEQEASNLAAAVKRFGFAIPRLLAKYKEDVIEQQMCLDRLATAAIALYTSTAVLSKLDTDLAMANGNRDSLQTSLGLGKFYCRMAFEQIDESLDSLLHNDDDEIYALSDRITGLK